MPALVPRVAEQELRRVEELGAQLARKGAHIEAVGSLYFVVVKVKLQNFKIFLSRQGVSDLKL